MSIEQEDGIRAQLAQDQLKAARDEIEILRRRTEELVESMQALASRSVDAADYEKAQLEIERLQARTLDDFLCELGDDADDWPLGKRYSEVCRRNQQAIEALENGRRRMGYPELSDLQAAANAELYIDDALAALKRTAGNPETDAGFPDRRRALAPTPLHENLPADWLDRLDTIAGLEATFQSEETKSDPWDDFFAFGKRMDTLGTAFDQGDPAKTRVLVARSALALLRFGAHFDPEPKETWWEALAYEDAPEFTQEGLREIKTRHRNLRAMMLGEISWSRELSEEAPRGLEDYLEIGRALRDAQAAMNETEEEKT